MKEEPEDKPSLPYILVRYLLRLILFIFFRDVEVVHKEENVPKKGAVIFVGNHQNQFVDPAMLISYIERPISFLIAEKSTKRAIVGPLSRAVQSIPVKRAQDSALAGSGKITSEGTTIKGVGTQFKTQFVVGDQIVAAGSEDPPSVVAIVSDTEMTVSHAFQPELTQPTSFKIWKKLDQSGVYEHVWTALADGRCIGIFPEGGSHDRTELLPLKAGVTIMALGAMAKHNVPVTIVPCGLNYFKGYKFRSHVLIDFGKPIEIPSELVEKYKTSKREACTKLLDMITKGLRDVTLNAPNFKTLQTILMSRRLYQPTNLKLPADQYLELNRRFAEGYIKLVGSGDSKVLALRTKIDAYLKSLKLYGIEDRQVMKIPPADSVDKFSMAFGRAIALLFVITIALPGFLINLPATVIVKWVSLKEAKKAKQASTVKIAGRDVIASYKILIAVVLVPLVHIIWGMAVAANYGWKWGLLSTFIIQPLSSYASIRLVENGMQVWKTSLPLFKSIIRGGHDYGEQLRRMRRELQREVRACVEEFGPKLFGEQWQQIRIVKEEDVAEDQAYSGYNIKLDHSYKKHD